MTESIYGEPSLWKEDKKYFAREHVLEKVGGETFTYRSLHGDSIYTPNKGYRPSMNPVSWMLMVEEEINYNPNPYVLGGNHD